MMREKLAKNLVSGMEVVTANNFGNDLRKQIVREVSVGRSYVTVYWTADSWETTPTRYEKFQHVMIEMGDSNG